MSDTTTTMMMKPVWLLRRISIGVKGVLLDQDGHVRALLEKAGNDYYCKVWTNIHDASVSTAVNRLASEAMEEAESMLLNAGIELIRELCH